MLKGSLFHSVVTFIARLVGGGGEGMTWS